MLLRVWGKANRGKPKSDFLRIPFGSYAITRGDIYHAGIYGKSGNFRFHMVMKTAEKFTISDKLHRMVGDKPPEPNSWKTNMYEENETCTFSTNYLAMLKEKCGFMVEEE